MEIRLPNFAFVALIGPSGAGKSHFAATHFPPHEVISYTTIAAMTGDDGSDELLHEETLALLHKAIELRLQFRKTVIVDAPLLTPKSRAELRRLARKYHVRLAAIVLETPLETCLERNEGRLEAADRQTVRQQFHEMEQTVAFLKDEGLRPTYRVLPEDELASIVRYKASSDLRELQGPFDIIGDVHGCIAELRLLLEKLGYEVGQDPEQPDRILLHHPKGRRLIFVGDLCDRGPDSPSVLQLVMDAVAQGIAYCVPGNHDDKLMRKLSGNNVQLKHGLEKTMAQLEGASPAFLESVRAFIDKLSPHLELDGGKLVVAHAGLKAHMHGRSSGEIQSFCLYGETTGETDEFGLPVRQNWAGDYVGKALVVYGHTPIPEPLWQGNTVNIDTGCVFGGALTALRYPERSTVSVPAIEIWSVPTRPIHWAGLQAKAAIDHSLDMNWVDAKVLVTTTDRYNLNLDEVTFSKMLQHIALRGVHPRWLIYAPPTISPPTASQHPTLLEHPAQAIDYYRKKGESLLVARRMVHGTPVVIVLCRDADAAQQRFQMVHQGIGAIYTRSGRPYFDDPAETQAVLQQMTKALEAADLWSLLKSDWLCLEVVASPIGAKAPSYIPETYAEVAATGLHASSQTQAMLQRAKGRGLAVEDLLAHAAAMRQGLDGFQAAYRALAGSPTAITWHLHQFLAVEGQVMVSQSQILQQTLMVQLAAALGPAFAAPEMMEADLDNEDSLRAVTAWWEEINAQGGVGLLIGAAQLRVLKEGELPQPWIKVRCAAYLRLLFGVDYDAPATLAALRERSLRLKRETALREFSLSKEALIRIVAGRPISEVFQCTLTAMGLELTPIDPRF